MSGSFRWRGALVASIFFLLGVLSCTTLRGTVEYHRALQAYKDYDYAMAEDLLVSILAKSPGQERALSLLGWVLFKQGRVEEAGIWFAEADRINPENIMTVEGLGWVQYSVGQDEEA